MIDPAFEILNQRGTPMFFSDVFANRPTAGIVGRIFISTDTYAFYRDTGSGWDLIGGPGTGTITGSGTIGTLPIWNGTQVIGDSSLLEGASKFTTTKDFQADGYYLSGMTGGSGALYWTSDRVTLANYNATGNVVIEAGGGQNAQTISGTNLSTTFYGNIIRNGGLSTQFLKADGSLDSNTYNTGSGAASQVAFWSGTNALTGENNLWWDSVNNHFGINTNTPATAIDVHHNQSTILQLNQTTATNDTRIAFQNSGSALWRIGNFYNAGANDWGIYDVIGAIQPLTIAKTTGQTFIGSKTTASGRLVVNSASSDAHIQVVGANAPSIRIDNAGTGATQRFVMGLSTATNNFIQGATAGDICISTASASPLLFGMWQTINASEVMRISTANNLLIGTSVDSATYGKLQVAGGIKIINDNNAKFEIGRYSSGASNSYIKLGPNSNSLRITDNLDQYDILTLTNAGNLGLGVTPSAWSGYKVLQLGAGSSLAGWGTDAGTDLTANGYFDGSNFRYILNASASRFQLVANGEFRWYNAPSGTAGNAITFTQAMTLLQNGNLGLGNTSPDRRLYVADSSNSQGTFLAYNQGASFTGTLIQGITDRTSNSAFNLMNLQSSTTSMFLVMGDGRIGVNTASPSNLRVTIENDGANLRLRNTSTRYRSDFSMSTSQLSINAYDDTAGTYMPISIDGSVTKLGNQGNVTVGSLGDNGNKLQVYGNTYTEGVYIATGQFSQGGSATSTFYTFSNLSSNRVFLITLRQSGAAGNSVVAMGFTYAGVLAAYNVIQDNTNPALFLTITSNGGLGLRLTTAAGYGTTTWEWTITQIK